MSIYKVSMYKKIPQCRSLILILISVIGLEGGMVADEMDGMWGNRFTMGELTVDNSITLRNEKHADKLRVDGRMKPQFVECFTKLELIEFIIVTYIHCVNLPIFSPNVVSSCQRFSCKVTSLVLLFFFWVEVLGQVGGTFL